MNKYDLSVLIPARNEMFLSKTVENILDNKRGKTEILVGLDGQWAKPIILDHDDVTIFYSPKPLGQRGMTNQLCRLSKAKYVMKLDAHCAVDEGFDVKLMADMHDNWTVIPAMYNLHAFDWVCVGDNNIINADPYIEDSVRGMGCGHTIYQGPTPEKCEKCGGRMVRELIFKPRLSKRSEFYRFDKTLHFQYWGAFKDRPEAKSNIAPSLSAQGSCFMLTRDKYWELEISDEKLAGKTGWGQQGVEVALKTRMSGGELMINKNTWYAHMFRTQGGDFGFPFPISGSEVDETRKKSRELLQKNKWPKAIKTFEQVLNEFYPVPEWHDETNKMNDTEKPKVSRSIVYYTDNQLSTKVAHMVQDNLRKVGLPIVSASLKPMTHFGKNIHIPLERGVFTYFTQILSALRSSDSEIVYFCEHDVLYHPSHFEFIPERKDLFYYNQNFWRIREDGFAVHWDANQVSGLVCYRDLAIEYYTNRINEIVKQGFNRSYEPGGRDKTKYEVFKSTYPNIDVRYGNTLTKSKWSPNDFRDKSTCVNWQEGTVNTIPGWNRDVLQKIASYA